MIDLQKLDPCPGCGARMYAHVGEFIECQNCHHQYAIAGAETGSPKLVQITVQGDYVGRNQNVVKIGNITSSGGVVMMAGNDLTVNSRTVSTDHGQPTQILAECKKCGEGFEVASGSAHLNGGKVVADKAVTCPNCDHEFKPGAVIGDSAGSESSSGGAVVEGNVTIGEGGSFIGRDQTKVTIGDVSNAGPSISPDLVATLKGLGAQGA